MTEKDARNMQASLAKPFAPEDLEWRLQNTIEESMRGMAVPYVTNRAIQNRLDEVCGPENWYTSSSRGTPMEKRTHSSAALPFTLKARASLPNGTALRIRTLSPSKAASPTA